jgi:lysophospholipase L1-like esterase
MKATLLFLFTLSITFATAQPQRMMKHNMLCLGDSYTIGESVPETERFPNQAIALLNDKGLHIAPPRIIAKTGWTTDELMEAIHQADIDIHYDYVTLLIGVNNQYRQYDIDRYRAEFIALLNLGIDYAGGDSTKVYVLSIPDWGVTPFVANDAHKRSSEQIGHEIDTYNKVNREITEGKKITYIDITSISRRAETDSSLIATDGLHPSGRMYARWAELLATAIWQHSTHK